jgi:hypothetical protein
MGIQNTEFDAENKCVTKVAKNSLKKVIKEKVTKNVFLLLCAKGFRPINFSV